ncbi:MAG: hypothetical protein KC535_01095 [Nanoarchaeota archaeon]|nr:hypothetical protein [Nanoarchaeota archaeon]
MAAQKQGDGTTEQSAVSRLNKFLDTKKSSVDEFSLDELVTFMNRVYTPKHVEQIRKKWDDQVAPESQIVMDLYNSNYTDILPSTFLQKEGSEPKLGANLSPRTVEGHAHSGHSMFRQTYGNTSLFHIISDDILSQFHNSKSFAFYGIETVEKKTKNGFEHIKAFSRSPREHYLEETQEFINSVVSFLEDALHSRSKKMSLAPYRHLELINSFFPPYITHVDTQALLKGAIFGGNFDNYQEIRQPAEQLYGTSIGGGEEYLLHVDRAKRFGINLKDLAKATFAEEVLNFLPSVQRIALLKKLRVIKEHPLTDVDSVTSWNEILEQGKNMQPEHKHIPVYIRSEKGSGVSDDAACIFVGFHDFKPNSRYALWYDSLQRGAHLMDAVDTLEKATKFFFTEGQDKIISDYIAHQWWNKIREDATYRHAHGISLQEVEQRVIDDGTTHFSLFPKQELIDLTAASANPTGIDWGTKHIHSSVRYFLQSVTFDSIRTQGNGRQQLELVNTNILNQEKIYAQQLFRSHGAFNSLDEEDLVPGNLYSSRIKIGFAQLSGTKVFHYLTKMAKQIDDPLTRRKNLIKHYKSR